MEIAQTGVELLFAVIVAIYWNVFVHTVCLQQNIRAAQDPKVPNGAFFLALFEQQKTKCTHHGPRTHTSTLSSSNRLCSSSKFENGRCASEHDENLLGIEVWSNS